MKTKQIKRNSPIRVKVLGLLLTAITLITNEAKASPCDALATAQDVLNCALERHPDIKISELGSAQSQQGLSVAELRPNPELNSQAVFGNQTVVEFNLAHTFELGGKRDSRIKRAAADGKLSEAFQAQSREQVYLKTLIALYRLRQLDDELATIDDALQTFSKIEKQYRSRPRLNPEQKASLSIFEVAEQDYKMKKAPVDAERDQHLRTLKYALGKVFVPKASALPAKKTKWPQLTSTSEASSGIGSTIRIYEADLAKAQADIEIAKSNAWPDLKLGPSVIIQRQATQNYEAYGVNFTLPLPLYHGSGAQQAFAKSGIERAAVALRAAKKENEDQKEYFQKRYEGAVKVLSESFSSNDLAKKHREVESLFSQGFLSGTVIVEIHRQVSDFVKTQNEQELAAIESLVHYHALNGKIIEVTE